jgi:4-amino-4-deoxy-L-arabinose transferase
MDGYFETPRQRILAASLLALLFGLLYLLFLGDRPLFIPDETRYGEIPREMLASGNWVVPRLNGLLYFEKPPFGYWMSAISLSLFGENPFAVRLSSAVATGMSALLVFAMASAFCRSRAIPFVAVFVFLTTLEVQLIGTFSVLDPVFSTALNAGILAMAAASYSLGGRQTWLLVLAGASFGIAFLTKGFLAFALPVLVVGPWLLVRKQYAFLFGRAWVAVAVAIATIAPWALSIHVQQPDFWRYFFWVEHIQRFTSDNAQHKEPVYYFLMYLPALAFPWVFLLPATWQGLKSEDSHISAPGGRLLLVLWAAVPLVFFSISKGKLATYILPCFLPFSLLTAIGLSSIRWSTRRMKLSLISAAVAVLLLLTAALVFLQLADEPVFLPGELAKQAGLLGSLAVMAVLLTYAAFTRRQEVGLMVTGASVIPFLLALPACLPAATLDRKAPEAFIADVTAKVPGTPAIVANGSLVRATSWSTKRTDIYVIENGGETTYGLSVPDGKGRFLDGEALADLVAREDGVLIFCKGACAPSTTAVLPAGTRNFSSGNFFAHYVPSRPCPDPASE